MPRFKLAPNPTIPAHYSVSHSEWMSHEWQLRKSLKTLEDYAQFFELRENEKKAFSVLEGNKKLFNIRTTPYYASLAGSDRQDPIRKILMPTTHEFKSEHQEMLDPLGELKNKVSPRLIHRYSDRVLFLVTDFCSVYCRYCTRKHFTGNEQSFINAEDFQNAIKYIQSHTGIREVILSGGDPLTLSDSVLEKVLSELRKIDHVEIIRVGSRMPVVCPQRITEDLLKMLKKFKPVFLMTHFNHPREITELAAEKLESIVDAGIPTFNQMVLLNGVNNNEAIVQALSRRLLYFRVKPYYMFQCDPSIGTDHLRTSLENSLNIQKKLWGHLSGLAMPQLSLDIPDGGGKAYYVPSFETHRHGNSIFYQGWDGVVGEYKNPKIEDHIEPIDVKDYKEEWEQIKGSKESHWRV